jgi:uncharacterized protein (DUF2141 family)
MFTLVNCAKTGAPSGGDKDVDPPKIIKSEPANLTTNFKAKRIRVYFNEYIKLKDIQKQLIISPPLKNKPIITPQGGASKYLEVLIKDTLLENTTYVFNFGQSIQDNNEGNPYEYFKYVFSTGDYIDSLTVSGMVEDGYMENPDQFISVVLYDVNETYKDSVVYNEVPKYITNTLDSNITFQLTNIKAGKYRLLALKDEASDNLFNQRTDKIAFLEKEISVPKDTLYLLTLFKEVSNFKASKPSLVSGNRMIMGYEGIKDSMRFKMLTKVADSFQYKIIADKEKDSLYYWFKGAPKDSLLFEFPQADSTVVFTVKMKELPKDTLVITNKKGNSLSVKDTFALSANTPLFSVDTTKISIVNKDTVAVAFKTFIDSLSNEIKFDFKIALDNSYKIDILPEAFYDFFGDTNDSLNYTIRSKKKSDFGTLKANFTNIASYPAIIQLLDNKNKIVESVKADENNSSYFFEYLSAGKYKIRVIYDANNNGKWDSGNYLKKIQPEKVAYFNLPDAVRANWDIDQTITFQERKYPDPPKTEAVLDTVQ